jgi:C1A family cysteine protease
MIDIREQLNEFYRQHGHFGLIRDERESRFALARRLQLTEDQLPPVDIAALPDSLGVASWLQIEDQMQIGSCQGHARTSAEELAIYRETRGEIVQLNRMFAYITSQIIDDIRGDQGSTLSGGAAASQKFGTCLEALWPYPGYYTRSIPTPCFDDAKQRRLRYSQTLRSYDEVLRWLVHGLGGVVIGIGWNHTCEPDAQGLVTSYKPGGGGHALAILDWTKRFVDAQQQPFLEMVNSWSRRWGVQGRAFIAPKVIEYWCQQETVLGYSDLDGPDIKPRSFDWVKGRVIA